MERQQPETIIFGGSFNPPTVAHSAVVDALVQEFPNSEIQIMPSAERTDKPDLAIEEHRLCMLSLLKERKDWGELVSVSDFELTLPRPTNTAQTIRALLEQGHESLWFVAGVDSLNAVRSWEEGEWLLQTLGWIVISREGYEQAESPVRFHKLDLQTAANGISSSLVREAIRESWSFDGLVEPSVIEYIKSNNLYKELEI